MYQHVPTKFGESKLYIWYDTPNTVYPDKVNSKGNDRNHWKVGLFEFYGGFLDTYKSPRQYPLPDRRNKWSYFENGCFPPSCSGKWNDSYQANREISVKCVKW